MQNSELTVKETEELQKSIASDLNKKDNDEKFKESLDAEAGGAETDNDGSGKTS
jgi:hypothetical protein